ncbi:helix-turn-helix domain-containing protein [Pseudonocardia sp. CA-107938]|uniref:helix-turn-helix domain-containing protein n=1 Tax=Pseudonocardia sp. CA-107938 TaxID=3240021 RepID=UPI003D8D23BF
MTEQTIESAAAPGAPTESTRGFAMRADRTTPLRAARTAAGLSQSAAARELVALAQARGAPVAGAVSLKTQLSRWENGHALPEPHYRELLAELYGRSVAELGLAPADPPPEGGLRARLAAAAAVDEAAIAVWREQLALTERLDAQLGAAGSAGPLQALVAHLDGVLMHRTTAAHRRPVAAVLADAAALAGEQALDTGDTDTAWTTLRTSHAAAVEAATATRARAAAGLAAVLVDVGEPAAALELIAEEPEPSDGTSVHLAVARGLAAAASGDRPASERAFRRARTLAGAVDQVHPAAQVTVDFCWGHALLAMGDDEAVTPLQRALDAGPPTVRARAGIHADLALSLATSAPESSAEHARAADELATRIGSTRIAARLRAR